MARCCLWLPPIFCSHPWEGATPETALSSPRDREQCRLMEPAVWYLLYPACCQTSSSWAPKPRYHCASHLGPPRVHRWLHICPLLLGTPPSPTSRSAGRLWPSPFASRPSGYQLRIFLEGARQCWHLLPGSSWAARLWASLNPLSSPPPPRGCLCFLAGVEPSARENKFSRCLALNLEEMGAYWERGSEGRHKVLKTPAFPGSRVGKGTGLKAG